MERRNTVAKSTQIQWTDATWNIARGCSKVDEDCKFCYMFRDSMDKTRYDPAKVVRTKTVFDLPRRLKLEHSSAWAGRPLIFTSSLTDFFHPEIDEFRQEAWDIIRDHPQYIFQILTKRPERIKDHLPADWGDGWNNVWLGTSIGSQKGADARYYHLITNPAKVHFLSIEPLWDPIDFDKMPVPTIIKDLPGRGAVISKLHYVNWVIIGGESGNERGKYRYRPCSLNWIRKIMADCKHAGVPVFVKQMGTHLSKELQLSDRHGGVMEEWPEDLRVREFPSSEQLLKLL